MSKRTDLLYFGRMLDEGRVVEEFVSEVASEAEFTSDRTLPEATTLHLDTIARMAASVSPEGKHAHPEIAWSKIMTLGGRIRLNQFDVEPSRVWKAATVDVPPLMEALSRFVPAEPPANGSKLAAADLAIRIPHERVAEFCRRWNIRRLAFFGSVIHGDYDPDRSDVDVLVQFEDGKSPGMAFFADVPNELAQILSVQKVDLVTFKSLNRWIRNEVLAEAVDEYVAA